MAGSPNLRPHGKEARITGKERDTESGNDYFEARYYSSNMGRFLSPDWSAKEKPGLEGEGTQTPSLPQTLLCLEVQLSDRVSCQNVIRGQKLIALTCRSPFHTLVLSGRSGPQDRIFE